MLADLGRGADLLGATASVRKQTPWLLAAKALATGAPLEAATTLAGIGAKPDEAFARLRASADLRAEGRRDDADEQLELALGFYRRVGATAVVREAERLLTTT